MRPFSPSTSRRSFLAANLIWRMSPSPAVGDVWSPRRQAIPRPAVGRRSAVGRSSSTLAKERTAPAVTCGMNPPWASLVSTNFVRKDTVRGPLCSKSIAPRDIEPLLTTWEAQYGTTHPAGLPEPTGPEIQRSRLWRRGALAGTSITGGFAVSLSVPNACAAVLRRKFRCARKIAAHFTASVLRGTVRWACGSSFAREPSDLEVYNDLQWVVDSFEWFRIVSATDPAPGSGRRILE